MESHIMRTERYLKTYEKMQAESKILAEDIRLQEYLLRTESIQGIKYGGEIGGGTSELTGTESAAHIRMEREEELTRMMNRKQAIDSTLEKIDWALASLSKIDEKIVRLRYIRYCSWAYVGMECSYSEVGARKRGQQALQEIAEVLFPMESRRSQVRIV